MSQEHRYAKDYIVLRLLLGAALFHGRCRQCRADRPRTRNPRPTLARGGCMWRRLPVGPGTAVPVRRCATRFVFHNDFRPLHAGRAPVWNGGKLASHVCTAVRLVWAWAATSTSINAPVYPYPDYVSPTYYGDDYYDDGDDQGYAAIKDPIRVTAGSGFWPIRLRPGGDYPPAVPATCKADAGAYQDGPTKEPRLVPLQQSRGYYPM